MKSKGMRWVVAAIMLLVLLFGWAIWHFAGGSQIDPAIEAKLASIREQLRPGGKQLSDKERRALMESARAEFEKLTPDQMRQLMERGRAEMQKAMEKRVNDYFALPEKDRKAALDRDIKEMEKWRSMGPPPGGPPPGGRPGSGPGGNKQAANSSSSQQKGPPGPPGGPHGPPHAMSHEEQISMRMHMLNHTSPQMRAYFQQLMQRRKELGLPIGPPGPPGGGGPPPGGGPR